MDLIADILLVAGAVGAAIYCAVLGSRLKSFATLETGMGGAIAVLSAQVDDMTRALDQARGAATGSAGQLATLTTRAESVAARLELLMAAMHDLPDAPPAAQPERTPPIDEDRRPRFTRRRSTRDTMEAAE